LWGDLVDRQVVILAAGMGTRLGRPHPKPLTELADGRSIMGQQMDNIGLGVPNARVTTVVGFKRDWIMEEFPDVSYIYNEFFDTTNTSKSLLKALRLSGAGGVMWFNGDVVFDPQILDRVLPFIEVGTSFVCVDRSSVGAEEVKYTVGPDANVKDLSKTVENALGEAVGINFVADADKQALIERLAEVGDQDYFERGMEVAITEDGLKFLPVDITDLFAVEVDFEADLAQANEQLQSES
jgi:choline kinase